MKKKMARCLFESKKGEGGERKEGEEQRGVLGGQVGGAKEAQL